MNRTIVFAKRNLKETLREPLSLVFNFLFPVALLLLFFCFIFGKTEQQILTQMPMFAPNKLVAAIAVFGFSFLTLFTGMQVAKDRSTAFITRLKVSPLKPYQFFLGYLLPSLVMALIQVVLVYVIGYLLSFAVNAPGIRFNLWSTGALFSIGVQLVIAIFFIAAGICIGTIINEKAVGGISSILVNLAAITGGMFMPLAIMGGFKVVCQCLPFYHFVTFSSDVANNVWPSSVAYFDNLVHFYKDLGIDAVYNILDTWYMHLAFIAIFTILKGVISILMFKKKMHSEN